MAYTKKVWKDAPDTSTPINAANLNHMEDGIATADVNAQDALDRLDDVDDEIAQINSDLINSFDSGLLTITPSGSAGTTVTKAISFHHAFSQIPSVVCTLTTGATEYFGALTVRDVSINGFTVCLHTLKPIPNPQPIGVNWMAIVHPE